MNRFQRARRDHRDERLEDYLELISDLINEQGEARVVDIAARMGVRAATVTQAVKGLAEEGWVEYSPYRPVTLTEKGQESAKSSRERHEILVRFLLKLGVSPDTAEHDSEGMEHHLSPETLEAMEKWLDDQPSGG